MKDLASLDDLFLLLAVADKGGLSAAARATGTSLPTLSRRMTALETQLGLRLFERGAQGYRITSEARQVLEAARPLQAVASRVASAASGPEPVRVRLTAGVWTSHALALALPATRTELWSLEFLSSNAIIDVARREADIGIRNIRPEQPWLAARRTGTIRYGVYAARDAALPFATRPAASGMTRSERWLREAHPDASLTLVNDPRLGLDLARAGLARIVLPRFVGDPDPALHCQSGTIDALTHDEWLVSHHDARHDPPIRAALDAVGAVLRARATPT
ncbi:LysR family transcriptional regulator [Pseudaestuariivita sp.]|uniref:LysR family transcriptional regulator n=1 Tax=Pseudaestuariivita sp. TaxID=2211669 RepID=UPI0040593527